MSRADNDSDRHPRRGWWLALAVLATATLLGLSFFLSWRGAVADLRATQDTTVRSRIQALETVLSRQRAVATVLSDDSMVRQALTDQNAANRAAISVKLERLREQTESAVIYLLDRKGVAIAASNWDEAQSFVGKDYSFRDYFSQALLRSEATQFALGTVSNRPGLYLSHDVTGPERGAASGAGVGAAERADAMADPAGNPAANPAPNPNPNTNPAAHANVLGVVVVKVEFDRLESNWGAGGGLTYVVDADGQIILTSQPGLRFTQPDPSANAIDSSAHVPGTTWTLTLRSPKAPAIYAAALGAGTVGFGLTLLAVAAGFWLRARRKAARAAAADRRYRADLERAVAERTRALSDEMRERLAAEARLGHLQGEMVQANKLAALGQITAGVAHEVNQPLATIRLLAENGAALLPPSQTEVAGNLDSILRMTDRIARITQQLRSFARKASGDIGPVPLAQAFEVALLLTATRREAQGIVIDLPKLPPDLWVMAETVRLEQILVNLLQNAQEALAQVSAPRIRIAVDDGATVRITIADNGPGLAPAIAAQLFTPFATSKPNGLGLGLVISQDIARDFGGSLRAAPGAPGQGATFILDLPRAA